MIYLYAITEALIATPPCPGLGGAPVDFLHVDGLTVAFSEHAEPRCKPDSETLWQHEHVVDELMRSATVLPARFGTVFADLEGVSRAVLDASPRLRTALERVRGCVELAVRVRLPEHPTPDAESGHAYLQTQVERHRAREQLVEATLAQLDELAIATRRREHAGVLKAAFLVPAAEVDRFAAQVQALQQRHSELSISCTGPWAPYSFADEEAL